MNKFNNCKCVNQEEVYIGTENNYTKMFNCLDCGRIHIKKTIR